MFTLIAVVTLALGIGANTAIFSVVDAVLLRPLPYPDANRLVFLWSTMNGQGVPQSGSALPDYLGWRDQNQVFEQIAVAGWGMPLTLTGAGEPEQLAGNSVTAGYFRVLDVPPLYGRTILDEEEQEMLINVFAFADRPAYQAMLPRTEVVTIDHDASVREFLARFAASGHTRFPVLGPGGEARSAPGQLLQAARFFVRRPCRYKMNNDSEN